MIKEQLQQDVITHLKAGNKMQVTTLRNMIGLINNREKGGKTPVELDDQQVEALLRKEAANRRETAGTYAQNGLPDRAEAETAEAAFIETYLPQGLTEDEAERIVTKVMDELGAEGALTMKDMGRAMKAVNAEIAGRFDGKAVSTMVRSRLA